MYCSALEVFKSIQVSFVCEQVLKGFLEIILDKSIRCVPTQFNGIC